MRSHQIWIPLGLLHRTTSIIQSSCIAIRQSRCPFSTRSALFPDSGTRNSMPSNDTNPQGKLQIVKEELCYSRYLNVYNRVVEFPITEANKAETGVRCTTVDYDIVGSKTVSFHYCTVFPFNSSTKMVTLIKEYAQGANDFLFGVPTGGLSEKHVSLEDCVRKELSEEAHLREGTLIKLIPDGHPGILEIDPTPLSQDPEEIIETLCVDLPTLKSIMYGGSMMLPSIVTCNMALHYLHEHDIC
eukprot:c23515_g1_i1 orf=355-1083(-)